MFEYCMILTIESDNEFWETETADRRKYFVTQQSTTTCCNLIFLSYFKISVFFWFDYMLVYVPICGM